MSKIKIGNIKGPKGDKGETGAVGPKGEQGIQGPVGPAGGVNSVNGKTGDVDIADALDYTPAGGENLVLNSRQEISNNKYVLHKYELSERIELGQKYTVTIWGNLSDEKTGFRIFVGTSAEGQVVDLVKLTKIKDGVYTGTGSKQMWDNEDQSTNSNKVSIFPYPHGTSNTNNTIHRIKLERGTVTNPVWTPAPEDVVVRSELDALIKRVAALEAQVGITSADSSAELPSADVTENTDNMEVVSPMQEGDYMEEGFE